MYSIYLIKFTNYVDQFHEVHLGEISPKCTRFHNIKNLPRKNIPLNVLSLNVLSTVKDCGFFPQYFKNRRYFFENRGIKKFMNILPLYKIKFPDLSFETGSSSIPGISDIDNSLRKNEIIGV